jgi:hypothetical protein
MGMPWHKGITCHKPQCFLMIATGYRDKKKKKDTWAFGKVKRLLLQHSKCLLVDSVT